VRVDIASAPFREFISHTSLKRKKPIRDFEALSIKIRDRYKDAKFNYPLDAQSDGGTIIVNVYIESIARIIVYENGFYINLDKRTPSGYSLFRDMVLSKIG
jgi:hypothetical protein